MKKQSILKWVITMAAVMISLSGCNSGVSLTKEENDIIANYAAKVVVKTTYVDYTYIPVIREPDYSAEDYPQEPATDPEGNIITVENDYAPLADYVDMENVKISYKGCVVGNEYPVDGDALFVLEADTGRQLVVVEYDITNTGESELVYSTPEEKPVFRLVVGNDMKVRSFKNILLNDFSSMDSFTIAPGETRTAVIVFQVQADRADTLSKVEVQYGTEHQFISLPVEERH